MSDWLDGEPAPFYSLARAAWIPCVVTWLPSGEFVRREGPEGFADYSQAVEASRFLARAQSGDYCLAGHIASEV